MLVSSEVVPEAEDTHLSKSSKFKFIFHMSIN